MRRAAAVTLAVAACAAVLSFRPIYEPDLWWHLAHGRENAAGRIVHTNVFSLTYPDYRQQYTSWLFDTAAFLAWTGAGGIGIQLLQGVLLALTFALTYRACRTRAPAWSWAVILSFAFFIVEPRAIPRPHLVSFAGLAAMALLVERSAARRSWRPLVFAVPLVALWSNFHVECAFGVLLVGIYAAAELIRPSSLSRADAAKAAAVTAVCALATMATPYGWGLAAYLYENLSVPRILSIAELRPPYLPDYRAFFVYLGAGGLLLVSFPRMLTLREALTAVTFAVMGTMHLRETPLVLIVTAPMVAARLAMLASRGLDPRAIVITSVVAAVACSRIPPRLLFTQFGIGTQAVSPSGFFSDDAIEFVRRAGLEGPVFNSHNLGGYLAWTLYPRVLVFQDSRLQAYPPDHFRRIIESSRSQAEWDALVAGVDWAVLSVARPNQLSGAGRFPPAAWATVFEDDAMQVVVRRGGRYSDLIRGR